MYFDIKNCIFKFSVVMHYYKLLLLFTNSICAFVQTSSKFTVPVFFKTSLVFLLPFEFKKEKTKKRLTFSLTEKYSGKYPCAQGVPPDTHSLPPQ